MELSLWWIPVLWICILWVTIITTVLASGKYKFQNEHQVRFRIPILCAAGDSPPASILYSTGGTIAGCFLAATVVLESYRSLEESGNSHPVLNGFVTTSGCLAAICLCGMCSISVKFYSKLHNLFAMSFTFSGVLYQLLNVIYLQLHPSKVPYTTFKWRAVCASLNILSAVIMLICAKLVRFISSQEQQLNPPGQIPFNPNIPKAMDEIEFSISFSFFDFPKKKRNKDRSQTWNNQNVQHIVVQVWAFLQYLSLTITTVYFASYVEIFHRLSIVISNK